MNVDAAELEGRELLVDDEDKVALEEKVADSEAAGETVAWEEKVVVALSIDVDDVVAEDEDEGDDVADADPVTVGETDADDDTVATVVIVDVADEVNEGVVEGEGVIDGVGV